MHQTLQVTDGVVSYPIEVAERSAKVGTLSCGKAMLRLLQGHGEPWENDVFVVELDDTEDVLRLLTALKTAEEIISDPRGWPIWRIDPSGELLQPTARFPLSGARHTL